MKPVSDDPIESVMTTLGSASRYCSLTLGENSAPVDEMAFGDDVVDRQQLDRCHAERA